MQSQLQQYRVTEKKAKPNGTFYEIKHKTEYPHYFFIRNNGDIHYLSDLSHEVLKVNGFPYYENILKQVGVL